jgi:hypothetical protein
MRVPAASEIPDLTLPENQLSIAVAFDPAWGVPGVGHQYYVFTAGNLHLAYGDDYFVVGVPNATGVYGQICGTISAAPGVQRAVVTVDGKDYAVYVDGVEKCSGTMPTAYTPPTQPFNIGSSEPKYWQTRTEGFHGWMYEVRIYDRVLTPTERWNFMRYADY